MKITKLSFFIRLGGNSMRGKDIIMIRKKELNMIKCSLINGFKES